MERGDIYSVSLDPSAGREQQGRRPVFIISPVEFNKLTKTPIVLSITNGGNFACTNGFTVSLIGSGTNTTGVIRCDQPRAIDLIARKAKKIEKVPQEIIDEVLARFLPIFE
jgi:mRNA interferase ChpB